MQLEGHTGNKMDVRDNGKGLVQSSTRTLENDINRDSGKYWAIPFENIDPAGANDYFIYIKNTSSDKFYEITDIRISSSVAGQVELQYVTGTATGGSNITPVSFKAGAGASPTATIQSGTDITGLTNGGVMDFIQLDTVDKEVARHYTGRRIIPPNQAVALLWEEATGILTGTISLLETDEIES